ncbi:MAG TPA: glycosyltransferase family A protein [Streptosporangiaceae bacterium]
MSDRSGFVRPDSGTDDGHPRFSVVIPAYNEAEFLSSCLESLRAQDFRDPYEIIVVDNNSTDATAAVARSRGVTVVHEPKPGVCSARQCGTMAARGEIVVSTDADTTFASDWLSRIDRAFRDDPGRVAVAGPCRFADPPWWGRVYTGVLFTVVSLVARLTGRIVYVTATNIAFRKSEWPGYDTEATQGGDELGLLRRLRSRGSVAFLRCNPTFTSSRRLYRGLAYNVVVTCLYYYVIGYALNRLTGRRVVGMAPAFRATTTRHGGIRRRVREVASFSFGLVFCLMFGDLALHLVEAAW